MHSSRSIRLSVRFDRFSINTTSWTALESEEEEPCEESDSQTGQEKDLAEESDEGEPCEASESQTGQEKDAAEEAEEEEIFWPWLLELHGDSGSNDDSYSPVSGCLWMDVIGCMKTPQQVREVALIITLKQLPPL